MLNDISKTVRIKRVPVLSSIMLYKDSKSIAEALLDDDFSNNTLASLASIFLVRSKARRRYLLNLYQPNISYRNLRRVALALDNQGYMYDEGIYEVMRSKEKCRCHECSLEKPYDKDKKESQKKNYVPCEKTKKVVVKQPRTYPERIFFEERQR